jgi:glycosyltransferase involved in cell wall biosynthesis
MLVRAIDRVLGSVGVYSHMIAVSESVRASFSDYPHAYVDRVRVIPNAIRPIAPRMDRSTVRKSLGVDPNAILLATIGRLAKEKNVLKTVAGASRVPNVHLALVGGGPQRPEIESYITSAGLDRRVTLVGQVDHQAALDILFAADMFVQLSHVEGRSIALLEALCARKAILASDVPSQREALTSDDGTLAGMVCDPMDENAIAAAVSIIANNESVRSELGAKAAALAAGLDPEQMGRDYVSLLNGG